MIGNNSCGVHSVAAGRTADNVLELDILTYDGLRMTVGAMGESEWNEACLASGRRGEIFQSLQAMVKSTGDIIRRDFPHIPRRVSGFNLPQLLPENGRNIARALVGTEGTCVIILGAKLKLHRYEPKRALLIIGFDDVYKAADQVTKILPLGPIGLEGMDERLKDHVEENHIHPEALKLLPEGKGWLIAEFSGDTEDEAKGKALKAQHLVRTLPGFVEEKLYLDPDKQHQMWEVREAGLGATARLRGKGDFWPGWEDSAVPPEKMGEYLRKLRKLLDSYGYSCSFYGHFGDGCLHCRIDFDLTSDQGLRSYRDFAYAAARLVHSLGGSCSGEHGDGQSRGELLKEMYSPEILKAFESFKTAWDPAWRLNPGKVVKPQGMLENLRLGTGFEADRKLESHFKYAEDDGNLVRATMRCVGVGECRRKEGKTMCPSYRVTHEEKHCTRGRAHLLFEMLTAHKNQINWRDEEVKESLDLCLSCKGCKSDCPVGVDVATYKAEFLSHY